MAEVRLTVEKSTYSGLDPSQTAVNSTDTYVFANDGRVVLRVDNGDTSSETVTFTTDREINGLTIEDPTVTVPAGEFRFIGPFAPGVFNNGQDVDLAFSNGTSTNVEVIKV
jgi:hypothetical protein